MKKNKFLKFGVTGFLLVLFSQGYSQNLIVKLTDNSMQSFALTTIRSIKFNPTAMIVRENDNTSTSFEIADIDNYSFGGNISTVVSEGDIQNKVEIYPNPAKEVVNIIYESTKTEEITIEIVDFSGKKVAQVFKGSHSGKEKYTFNLSGLTPSGAYFCVIKAPHKSITKPLIIN